MILLLLAAFSIPWTPDLERAIQIQMQYTKDPAQLAVLSSLQELKNLDGVTEVPLGKVRITGYYTPLVYTREKAEKHAKMQGSAFLKNPKGIVKLMSYRGKKSGKDLYSLLGDLPRGASGTPLIAGYSAAVDPKIIPYGSVLLAHIDGKPRLLFAQDTGGKVQRNHEIDIYTGIGEKARKEAMKHYKPHEVSLLSLSFDE
ncbi:MAG: 3D domain-containing protein [Myxococcaceae bacterium]